MFEHQKITIYSCQRPSLAAQVKQCVCLVYFVCVAFVHKRQSCLYCHRSYLHYALSSHQIASPLVSGLNKNITAVKIWSKEKQLDKKTVSAVHVESGMAGHAQTSAISNQTWSTFYSQCYKSWSNGLAIRITLLYISRSAYTLSPAEVYAAHLHNPELYLFTCSIFYDFGQQSHIIILRADKHRSKYSINKSEFLSKLNK